MTAVIAQAVAVRNHGGTRVTFRWSRSVRCDSENFSMASRIRSARPHDADELAVTENTARTHVKRVLAKADCRTQADLVRVLLSGPAGLAATPV